MVANRLNQTAEGRQFLDNYNKFVLIYGGARAYVELMGLTKSMRGANETINDTEADDLLTKLESKVASLDQTAQTALKGRGLAQDEVDKIIIRAMYIDDELGNNAMLTMIKDLAQNPNFKNPDDILSNLHGVFRKPTNSGNVNLDNAKNLLKEFEEGKYWIDQGNEVYISKKWSGNADEVDVTITTTKTLIECKNITGGADAVRDRVLDIIGKYTIDNKLSPAIKNQYPNHFGKISISNTANEFYNLNKQQIIIKFREEFLDLPGGIEKNKLVNAIQKLYFENGQGRIIIKNTDWQ